MHRQLRSSNVNTLDSSFRRNHWANGRSTSRVVLDNKVLNRDVNLISDGSEDASSYSISGVPLVRVGLEDDTVVELRSVQLLVLF